MKAFLLAAGKGTRLQPLTFEIPKCLVPVGNKPLIEYWFDLFEQHGIDEVLINTSHLAEKVESYVRNHPRSFKVHLVHEETLRGSGGTVKENWDFVEGEKSFFICYADNLTNIDLKKMLQFHDSHGRNFTLAVFQVVNPRECGIIEMDEKSSIISFVEKPLTPVSDLAFAGIMLSSPQLVDYFPDSDFFDLAHDVLPRVAGHASGYIVDGYLLDIGSPDKLDQAEKDMKNGKIKCNHNVP